MKLNRLFSQLFCFGPVWLSGPLMAADAPPAPPTTAVTQPQPALSPATHPTPRGNDQLILDSTLVTGNRELPKVMYIVPWKKAELSDLPGQPFNTLIDETLTPVDREVFRREVDYYQVISTKDGADRAAPTTSAQATPAADRK